MHTVFLQKMTGFRRISMIATPYPLFSMDRFFPRPVSPLLVSRSSGSFLTVVRTSDAAVHRMAFPSVKGVVDQQPDTVPIRDTGKIMGIR
mmetsp:Transcript_11132/g.26246  ORF Transcript_11132/g.26246 Transcript_11132/m.26246 type:complete len:90 (+) Transcript_11132:2294-2563(+)